MKSNTHMTYERDAISSYLVIQGDATRVIQEYEVEMIKRNPIDSFLDLHILAINGEKKLYYNITSKQLITTTLERKKLSYGDMCHFFNTLIAIVKDCNKYFLSSLKINLEPEMIYVSPHDFKPKFVYIPYEDEKNDIQNDLRVLIEYFFDKVNQDDVQGVMMIHKLFTASKKDDFDLVQVEMMVNKDHREVEQKTQQPTISHLVENKSIDAIEDDNKQRLHKAVTHSHMDSQNYPMHSNSTEANECDRLNKENTNGKDNIKQFSQPSKTPQENEDRQVIEQLIKRNKQRQELVGADEPLPKTNAFRQNRKKNDKPKQKERKQVKAMSNTKHTKQPNKGAFKSQTVNDKPLKKEGLPSHYLGIGLIQVLVILLFLIVLKNGILHSETDGSLRLDALLASIAMLMALNLYGSKKLYDHWQAKQVKGSQEVIKPSINMHKQKVYNRPSQSTIHQGNPKQEKNNRSSTTNEQPIQQPVRIQRDDVVGMHPNSIGKNGQYDDIQYKEQLVNQHVTRASFTGSEDTELLDAAQRGIGMETKPCLVRKDRDIVDKIIIASNPFIIGKLKNQVDYIMENSSVSRIHCKIIEEKDQYYIIDLNSKNGTFLDEEPLVSNKEYPLYDGSQISISNCTYTFEIGYRK